MKPLYFVILGVIVGLTGFLLYILNPFGLRLPHPFFTPPLITVSPSPSMIPAPTPYLILPTGKQTFFVRGAEQDSSKISQIDLDPLDAIQGQSQTIDISVNSIDPITNFKIILFTDTGQNTYTPTLKSGTSTKGVWTTTYSFPDNAKQIYSFTFEIITSSNQKTVRPFLLR